MVSDLSLTAGRQPRRTNLVGRGQADLLLAFDLLDRRLRPGRRAPPPPLDGVWSPRSSTAPVGRQISNPALEVPDADALMARLGRHVDPNAHDRPRRRVGGRDLVGSKAAANILLLGVAVQFGVLPIPVDAVEQAIRLNGVAVERNLAAFTWGRRWVADRPGVEQELARRSASGLRSTDPLPERLAVGSPSSTSRPWSCPESAARGGPRRLPERGVRRPVPGTGRPSPRRLGDAEFAGAVAGMFHKLLAYKDEYEVARLMRSPDGLAPALALTDGSASSVSWQLHPPMLRALGMRRKLRFRHRSAPIFAALARGKRLRGTPLDPFGRSALRRLERELPAEYESAVEQLVTALADDRITAERATEIAGLPDQVRGYEDLKIRRAGEYRAQLAAALSAHLSRPPLGPRRIRYRRGGRGTSTGVLLV